MDIDTPIPQHTHQPKAQKEENLLLNKSHLNKGKKHHQWLRGNNDWNQRLAAAVEDRSRKEHKMLANRKLAKEVGENNNLTIFFDFC